MGRKKKADSGFDLESVVNRALETGQATATVVNVEKVAAAVTPMRYAAIIGKPETMKAMSEKTFQDMVCGLLTAHDWEWYHTHDSRGSKEGFLDITAWRGSQLFFAELKREGEEPTDAQVRTMRTLARTGNAVYLWYPHNWDELEKVITNYSNRDDI